MLGSIASLRHSIGGLGHLAIQFARACGEVTLISPSPDRRQQAGELGANHFITTRGAHELAEAASTFGFILSTVSADIPWDEYLAALSRRETLGVVGVPESAMQISPLAVVLGEEDLRRFTGVAQRNQADTQLRRPHRSAAKGRGLSHV